MRNIVQEAMIDAQKAMTAVIKSKSVEEGLALASVYCLDSIRDGRKVMIVGNGGSAAQAQHMSSELTGRFKRRRPGMAAVSLTTDSSALTAIGNDFGFDHVFSQQLEAIGNVGDTLVVFSTSGNSKNVIEALKLAKASSIKTVGFCGESGGEMKSFCEALIRVPSHDPQRIQEAHLLCSHILCEMIEENMYG